MSRMTNIKDHPGAQIATGIARLGQFIRTESWRSGQELGLTPTQMRILRELAAHGPLRVGALAKAVGVSQPTATDAFEALRRKGLAEKGPDPDDGRAVAATITAAGRRRLASASDLPDVLLDAIAEVDAADRGAFARGLTTIVRALQRREAIPVQRMCVTCRYFRPHAHDDPAAPHHCAFVDAAFGDAQLRLDCGEHVEADTADRERNWRRFSVSAE